MLRSLVLYDSTLGGVICPALRQQIDHELREAAAAKAKLQEVGGTSSAKLVGGFKHWNISIIYNFLFSLMIDID